MSSNNYSKLDLLLKARKILKNWYLLPMIYLGIFKKNQIILKTKNDLQLSIRANKSNDIHVFSEIWLEETYLKWKINFSKNSNVIDIGSHIGLFTLQIASMNKNSNIFCFEPNNENFNMLKNNIKINNLKKIKIFQMAVSFKNGETELSINKNDSSGHSIKKEFEKKENVKTITLKKILDDNQIEHCDLLKLDCEGAEYEILFSTSKNELKKIKQICLEYHKLADEPKLYKKLIDFLEENGFKIEIEDFEKNGFIFAKR